MKNFSIAAAQPTVLRCAVYTRKSTTKGLDSEFSSLESQREACEAYIRSQAGNRWILVPTRYDDGGFTGGNLDRPALEHLLEDIKQDRVDVVVCYKVDRLCRSLLDFARLMEIFAKHEVNFVSVTQSFDTTTSMGRLTLNILLSFAQFERELIAERTRDKIQASRRRGKWTGGVVPFGYQVIDKRLVPDPATAPTVRQVFEQYLSQGSTSAVAWRLGEQRPDDPTPWTKHRVARILRNPLYAGLLAVGSDLCTAEHEPLVPAELRDRALKMLDGRRTVFERHSDPEYVLRGLLRCECGAAIVPGTTKKDGKKYRYYRCRLRTERGANTCATQQMAAPGFEAFVLEQIARLAVTATPGAVLKKLEHRIERLQEEASRLPEVVAAKSLEASQQAQLLAHLTGIARRGPELRLQSLSAELSEAESRSDVIERELHQLLHMTLPTADAWVPVLEDFRMRYPALDVTAQARFLREVMREIVVSQGGTRVELRLHDWLADALVPAAGAA